MFLFEEHLTFASGTIYSPQAIELILANFELVKYSLSYIQVNKHFQIKAGPFFYSPGKCYWWPVKSVSLREFTVSLL